MTAPLRVLGEAALALSRPAPGGDAPPAEPDLLQAGFAVVAEGADGTADPAELLHPAELETAAAFRHAPRRASYVGGRVAAKLALRQRTGLAAGHDVRIGAGVFGQPIVAGAGEMPPSRVSIAHGGALAAAVAFHPGHPMGLDLEPADTANAAHVRDELTAGERDLAAGMPLAGDEAALMLWAAKESLGKALTTGLMTPLSVYEIDDVAAEGPFRALAFANFAQYRALTLRGAHGWFALALPRRTALADGPWRAAL